MRLALTDVQGYDMAVIAIAVDESNVVEEAEVQLRVLQPLVKVEAALARAVRSGNDC